MKLPKKQYLIAGSIIIVLVIAIGVVLTLHAMRPTITPLPTRPVTVPSDGTPIPATKDEQNAAAKKALDAALIALNNGNKAEANKQLAIAEKLYKAAGNQEGIDNVEGLYPTANAIPEKSPTPSATAAPRS